MQPSFSKSLSEATVVPLFVLQFDCNTFSTPKRAYNHQLGSEIFFRKKSLSAEKALRSQYTFSSRKHFSKNQKLEKSFEKVFPYFKKSSVMRRNNLKLPSMLAKRFVFLKIQTETSVEKFKKVAYCRRDMIRASASSLVKRKLLRI